MILLPKGISISLPGRICPRSDEPQIMNAAAARTTTGYDLVIFDCDGVLVDSETLACRCLVELLQRHGIDVEIEVVFERFLGRSISAVAGHFQTLGRVMPDGFPAELRVLVRKSFADSLQAMADVVRVLRSLDTPYCVASSSDLDRVNFSLDLTGLSALFAGRVFTAQMVQNGKPAPDLFLYAAARLGVDPARTLVVEDSASGVQAGKAAGMTVWGFVGGSHYTLRDGRALLAAAGADRVFDRMADFQVH
jgi:HAD superfamily hydrolase (TIGR01509 family)